MAERTSILVVEDERDTAEMLAAYFESQGYRVLQATWGRDALKIIADTLPDLVLLDIRLPDIDGYEVCRAMRQHRRTQNTPIIFLTERRERIDRLQGLELGAVDYITKPFDIQELKLRVRNALRRAKYETLTDPVTGLPGESLTREHLNGLMHKRSWGLIGINVTGLEAFGEAYGFVARDDTLRALALMFSNVSQESEGPEAFVGHIDRTEFVIIADPDRSKDMGDRLAARLRQSIGYFYPFKDERKPDSPRPEIKILIGVVNEHQGPFADANALIGTLRSAQRPV